MECEVLRDILWQMCTGQLVYNSGAVGRGEVKDVDLGSSLCMLR